MRVVAIVLWAVAALAMLLPVARRPRLPTGGRDELVKDPVCHIYVPRSRAVTRRHGGDIQFFCSAECARRYGGA